MDDILREIIDSEYESIEKTLNSIPAEPVVDLNQLQEEIEQAEIN